MATALDSALGLSSLPITSRVMGKATGKDPAQITAGEMFPAMQERRGEELRLRQSLADTESQLAGKEQEQKVAGLEQKQSLQQVQATELRDLPKRTNLNIAREELNNAAFVPTKENAQDIATIFSLVGIIGMAIGGGAKDNAYAAMSGMNGMLEGYKRGRADVYKRERDMFDKNLKALQTKVQTLQQELTEAIQLKQQDFKAGETAIEIALAKSGSDLLDLKRKKNGDMAALETVVQTGKDVDSLVKMSNDQFKQAQDRQFKEKELQQQERLRMAQLAQTKALAELKAGGGAGKPLPAKEVSAVEGLSSLSDSLRKLEQDFKPEFAGMGLLGFGAEAQLEAMRRLGGKKAQEAISWWSRYNRLQAPNRHSLFGATLTGNELKNFQSFTAKTSDSAETVKTMLRDQADYSEATARQKVMQYESAGYRVPQLRQVNFEQTYGGDSQGQPSVEKYQIDQIITKGNKKYRITGLSDPNDPDVEEVK